VRDGLGRERFAALEAEGAELEREGAIELGVTSLASAHAVG
jgi:hypothetical protein